jgi:hypothetical protein
VELARLRRLPLEAWAPGAKSHYVRILPAVLTGRRIWAPGGPSRRGGGSQPGVQPAQGGEVRPWAQT